MSFSTRERYPKLGNGPPPERRRVDKDKNKSATNVSAREVGSCHEKKEYQRKVCASNFKPVTLFFSLTECDGKDFCLRSFG